MKKFQFMKRILTIKLLKEDQYIINNHKLKVILI